MPNKSTSFDLLDERVRKWIFRQGWYSLRDIQENAIPVVLSGDSDVIISASTAGGKTEAAFLPILTRLLRSDQKLGYQVLYLSPLKALINDQYRRLSDMTLDIPIQVNPWHGDISASRKKKSIQSPNGILIITPESLESLLINRTDYVLAAFSSLHFVVIDELHSFIGTERGKQLQSLLSRIELIIRRRIPRIAMSATFSNYDNVKNFIRNDNSLHCVIPRSGESNHEIKILLKEFVKSNENITSIISTELYNNLRGSNNLIFANSRVDVEEYAVQLSDMCEKKFVPNEFKVHHGSISKIQRETIEHEMQEGNKPITAICTSTLELGVDIGKVKSIVQIGTAFSVSGLRQRLGRSGRRGEPSILRVYSIELNSQGLMYDLRSSLVQNIAIIELMREQQYESVSTTKYHFSTLIQQTLSIITQFGGFYPKDGWHILCKNGAFKNVNAELFLELLKSLGEKKVISQLNTGQIIIGKAGEKILKSQDFYAAFTTSPEIVVIDKASNKRIGTLQYTPKINSVIILSGNRWLVERIDNNISSIYVSSVKSGGKAKFGGEMFDIDRIIAKKMFEIYQTDIIYAYLDDRTHAKEHLAQSRHFFHYNKLNNTPFIRYGNECYYINWAGTNINRTIALLSQYCLNKRCEFSGLFVSNLEPEDIKSLRESKKPSLIELAAILPREQKTHQKYDYLLSDKLLDIEYANNFLDDKYEKWLLF